MLRNRVASTRSLYGSEASDGIDGERAAAIVPKGGGGLVWHAQVLADGYKPPAKMCRPDGSLKARRPLPQARASDFFSSLVQTPDGRWIFTGILNGWPALQNLEVRSITCKARKVGASYIKRLWNAGDSIPPDMPDRLTGVRVTLRGAPWTGDSFSLASRGFAFHYRHDGTLAFGMEMLGPPPLVPSARPAPTHARMPQRPRPKKSTSRRRRRSSPCGAITLRTDTPRPAALRAPHPHALQTPQSARSIGAREPAGSAYLACGRAG